MYRKIDIALSPALVLGSLERRDVCPCGFGFVKDDVPIGRQYSVDTKSVRWGKFQCGGCGRILEVRLVDVWDKFGATWFILDVLDLDRAIPFMPKPDSWMPVRNNKVAPKQAMPGGGQLIL